MKKRAIILSALLVAVLVFLLRDRPSDHRTDTRNRHSSTDAKARTGALADATKPRSTKASERSPSPLRPTHSPMRLREFFLPTMDIDGLPLAAALERLAAAYADACREAGEVPVKLEFDVPPGYRRPLKLPSGSRTLDGTIRMLAALSGLKVTREDATYRFTAPEETGERITRKVPVPPDYTQRIGPHLGLELDPSTRLTFRPDSSTLEIESSSAADRLAIESMARLIAQNIPVQHKIETKIIALPADIDWQPPTAQELDAPALSALMRELAQRRGVELMTAPAITARQGQQGDLKLVREFIAPRPGAPGEFDQAEVGIVLAYSPEPLGFGHRLGVHLTETTGGIEEETMRLKTERRTDLEGSGYTHDGNASLHLQTRPDGSRVVLLVTPTMIDATGRPLRSPAD